MVDEILKELEEWSSSDMEVAPLKWLNAAARLTMLMGPDSDKLFLMQQELAKKKAELSESMPAVKAQAKIEALDLYREARQLEAKIDRVHKICQIAKKQATLKDNEFIS